MRYHICTAAGILGSLMSALFGGWDAALATLVILMGIDYISGLLLAGVFHRSPKTENGALESKAGWKGLCRKGVILCIVLIGYRLDLVMHTDYIRDGVTIAFIANEAISIIENAGLMGVPMPAVIVRAIEALTEKQKTE